MIIDSENNKLMKFTLGILGTLLTVAIIWIFSAQASIPKEYATRTDFQRLENVCVSKIEAADSKYVQKVEFQRICERQDERWKLIQESLNKIERKLP